MKILSFIIQIIRQIRKIGRFDRSLYVGSNVTINNKQCVHFGKNVHISKDALFLPVCKYAGVHYKPNITIGDGSFIGIRNSFASIDYIRVGKNVLFAGFVHLTDHSHGYEDISRPIKGQQLISKGGITIEDDCWIGFSCEILSGVHIGSHSIVAARAVVTKDVPANCIVAGNPARIVKQYNSITKQWENICKK